MVEQKYNIQPDWSDDSEEEERAARGIDSGFGGGGGAIRSATFVEQ